MFHCLQRYLIECEYFNNQLNHNIYCIIHEISQKNANTILVQAIFNSTHEETYTK